MPEMPRSTHSNLLADKSCYAYGTDEIYEVPSMRKVELAEENLLAMRREVEEKNRQMLRTEYWIAFPAVIYGLVMVFVASFIEMPVWLRIVLIVFALVMIFTVAFIAVGIEQKAGYYECQKCHDRHIPTYWQTNLAMHMGRTRYMKCPVCGKWSWQKKVLTKEE